MTDTAQSCATHSWSAPYRNTYGEAVQHCVNCAHKRRNEDIPVYEHIRLVREELDRKPL